MRRRSMEMWLALLLYLIAPRPGMSQFSPSSIHDRLVYCSFNLMEDRNIDVLENIFQRASKAGYTGVVLGDVRFGRLDELPPRYFQHIERLKNLAAASRLEIIPSIFPIGYSESLLYKDPNLAEGLPVRDALFVVSNGVARLVADPPVALRAGDFGDLTRWDLCDPAVTADNGTARVSDPQGKRARIAQRVKLHPFRQYHISVRVKTKNFIGTPEIKVLAGETSLQFTDLGVQRTQDWTLHHIVFNSLDHAEAMIYFGCWDGTTGSLWWDDARIEEVGLLNLVRREGAPLEVRHEDGPRLTEGKDFERVIDPRMGTVPYPGGYEVWHEPPVIRTGLPDGTRLRVSYDHATIIGIDQVTICPSEPKTVELLRDMAKRVHAAWGAKSYFMNHDEIRVLNWDASCSRRNLDAGEIVADNVRTCIRILHEVNPGGRIFVWSDMFDPNHNAHKNYFLVHGDLGGSWEGLDRNVIIAVWYYEQRNASLQWFAHLGNPMLLAGYYDAGPEQIRGWLDSARRVRGVEGVMYTTWQKKYDDLEPFATVVNGWK